MTSAAELQRQAAAYRADLSNTLGQLREGATPSALSAELAGVMRDAGWSLIRGLADSARQNPVPTLLIGAGLTMLLTRTTGGDVVSTASSAFKAATAAGSEAARTTAGGVRDWAAGAMESTTEAAKSTVARAGQTASDVAHAVREKTGQATESFRATSAADTQRASDLLTEGQDKVRHLNEDAARLASQGRHALTQLLEEQPVLVAAVGAALGALLGAALPTSQTEKELLGKLGSDAIDRGRDALERTKGAVGEELASAKLGETLGQAAERVVEAAVPPTHAPSG